jgi:hypothetical protein
MFTNFEMVFTQKSNNQPFWVKSLNANILSSILITRTKIDI